MANKYKKVSFVLRKELVIIVLVILALVGATVLLNLPTKEEKLLKEWSAASSDITSVSLFESVNTKDLDKALAKGGKVFVMFGAASDTNSVSLLKAFNDFASTAKVEKIYLLDATDYLGDRKADNTLDEKLKVLEAKYQISISEIPTAFYFNDGKLIKTLNTELVAEQSYSYVEAVKALLSYNLAQ